MDIHLVLEGNDLPTEQVTKRIFSLKTVCLPIVHKNSIIEKWLLGKNKLKKNKTSSVRFNYHTRQTSEQVTSKPCTRMLLMNKVQLIVLFCIIARSFSIIMKHVSLPLWVVLYFLLLCICIDTIWKCQCLFSVNCKMTNMLFMPHLTSGLCIIFSLE